MSENNTAAPAVRETKVITTPGGRKIEVLTYITGREKRQIDEVYSTMELKQKGGDTELSGIRYGMLNKLEDKEIETIVKSIDGKTDDILNTFLDLPFTEIATIKDHVNEITGKKKLLEQQKQSQGTSEEAA